MEKLRRLPSVLALLCACLSLASTPAQAVTFLNETEPNNTSLTANAVGSDPDALISASRLADGSADYFAFQASAGSLVSLQTIVAGEADTILALYDSGANLLSFADDGGGGLASAIGNYEILIAGTYFVAVGDVGDAAFLNPDVFGNPSSPLSGGGASDYSYQLQVRVTPVPEPAATAGLVIFGVGGIGMTIRRRRLNA